MALTQTSIDLSKISQIQSELGGFRILSYHYTCNIFESEHIWRANIVEKFSKNNSTKTVFHKKFNGWVFGDIMNYCKATMICLEYGKMLEKDDIDMMDWREAGKEFFNARKFNHGRSAVELYEGWIKDADN